MQVPLPTTSGSVSRVTPHLPRRDGVQDRSNLSALMDSSFSLLIKSLCSSAGRTSCQKQSSVAVFASAEGSAAYQASLGVWPGLRGPCQERMIPWTSLRDFTSCRIVSGRPLMAFTACSDPCTDLTVFNHMVFAGMSRMQYECATIFISF